MIPLRLRSITALWKTPSTKVSAKVLAESRDKELIKRIMKESKLFAAYILRFQQGEAGIAEILIRAHFPLMLKYVHRYGRAVPQDAEDLMQTARLAFLEGCARYDGSNPDASTSYVWKFVKSHVCREVIDSGTVVRIPVHCYHGKSGGKEPLIKYGFKHVICFSEMEREYEEYMDHSFDENLVSDAPSPEDLCGTGIASQVAGRMVNRVYGALNERERSILRARLCENRTLTEVGKESDISRERTRQLQHEALLKFLPKGVDGFKPDRDDYANADDVCAALVEKLNEAE